MKMLIPRKERTLSAKAFLKEAQSRRQDIKSVRFIPPKIGGKGYGKFVVEYRHSILVKE